MDLVSHISILNFHNLVFIAMVTSAGIFISRSQDIELLDNKMYNWTGYYVIEMISEGKDEVSMFVIPGMHHVTKNTIGITP
jgi:hypothetical protein